MKRSDFDLERFNKAKKLKPDNKFKPCPVNDGDELYPNGIFVFNITKMNEYLEHNQNKFDLVEIAVADFPKCFSSINETHVGSVSVLRPVILAEISPGHYNLIDGNHRVEKARRTGIRHLLAYKLNVHQHIKFLTELEAYLSYVEYWNGKIK